MTKCKHHYLDPIVVYPENQQFHKALRARLEAEIDPVVWGRLGVLKYAAHQRVWTRVGLHLRRCWP